MKRKGGLFDEICSIDNLRKAFYKAADGKHGRKSVKRVEDDLDNKLKELRAMLLNGEFHTSEYRTKTIYEPKERVIYILPFWPDRVVHHAIMNVIEPYWTGLFDVNSFSCVKGRGQHKASAKCLQYVKHYKEADKADIHHFYPSLNHRVIKRIIRKKIKDKRLLALLDDIIDSIPGETNVPIGNLISQWFGNLYLNELDKFIRQELHCKAYLRYCDDFILFSNSHEQLKEWKARIDDFVHNELLLDFSRESFIKAKQGIDFIGYRHFPQGYILVRKSTVRKTKKNLKEVRRQMEEKSISPESARGKVESAHGWISWANAHNLEMSLDIDNLRKEAESYAEFFRNSKECGDRQGWKEAAYC